MRVRPWLDRRVDEKVKRAMKTRETRRSSRWVGACIAQGCRIDDWAPRVVYLPRGGRVHYVSIRYLGGVNARPFANPSPSIILSTAQCHRLRPTRRLSSTMADDFARLVFQANPATSLNSQYQRADDGYPPSGPPGDSHASPQLLDPFFDDEDEGEVPDSAFAGAHPMRVKESNLHLPSQVAPLAGGLSREGITITPSSEI